MFFCFQLEKERYLMAELEKLQLELKPMEDIKAEIDRKSAQRTNIVVWGGLGYMAFQFGLLARLTWWEYSWDIMEPVTYFVGYGTAMACYAFFVLTRQVRNGHHRSCIHECLSNTFFFCFFFQEFLYPDARDRQFLLFFHKLSKRKVFDIRRYNEIKDAILKIEADLQVLRSPLFLHLPENARMELLEKISQKEDEK